jgi:hypothetical protein
MELTPAFINTQGGARLNKHAPLIDTDSAPIQRRYSARKLGSIYSFLYQGEAISVSGSRSVVTPAETQHRRFLEWHRCWRT